jgi:hypothetical protein
VGDLFEPVLTLKQRLPDLKARAGTAATEPARSELDVPIDEHHPSPRKAARTPQPKKSSREGPGRKKMGKV